MLRSERSERLEAWATSTTSDPILETPRYARLLMREGTGRSTFRFAIGDPPEVSYLRHQY